MIEAEHGILNTARLKRTSHVPVQFSRREQRTMPACQHVRSRGYGCVRGWDRMRMLMVIGPNDLPCANSGTPRQRSHSSAGSYNDMVRRDGSHHAGVSSGHRLLGKRSRAIRIHVYTLQHQAPEAPVQQSRMGRSGTFERAPRISCNFSAQMPRTHRVRTASR